MMPYFNFHLTFLFAVNKVNSKHTTTQMDAKIEFRCCMDRLTKDLRLYKISPQDLIKILLPSKAIKNEKILETLNIQANTGIYRVNDSFLEACQAVGGASGGNAYGALGSSGVGGDPGPQSRYGHSCDYKDTYRISISQSKIHSLCKHTFSSCGTSP